VRQALFNSIPPKNTDILMFMQDVWSDPMVSQRIEVLFRSTANPVTLPRRTSRTTDNLLHICLYVLLTQVHRRNNRKYDLFKRPEEFPMSMTVRLREKLSCLSRYLEAAMYTSFHVPDPDSDPVFVMDTCNVCSEDDVSCVTMCTTGLNHTACKTCIMRHTLSQLEKGDKTVYDVRCMFSNDHHIAVGIVRWAIGPFAYLERMQKSQETALSNVVLVHCPNAQCEFSFVKEDTGGDLQCPQCRVIICQHCNRLGHDAYMTPMCTQSAFSEYEDLLNAGMTLCPNVKCRIPVERDDMDDPACIHMTCSCGHGYCWLCLGDWESHRGSFYACTKDKSLEYTELYDDTIRRYYPQNPLSVFSTIDMSEAPAIHSLTIAKFSRGRLPLPEKLITDGRTLCPNCFETATKNPAGVHGLHTTCPSCDHKYCWQCIRPATDHTKWRPGDDFQSICGMPKLPAYAMFYDDHSRKVYPGLNNIRFNTVLTKVWPFLTFNEDYVPTSDEIRTMKVVRTLSSRDE
jgi:hypothetical protein